MELEVFNSAQEYKNLRKTLISAHDTKPLPMSAVCSGNIHNFKLTLPDNLLRFQSTVSGLSRITNV